MEKCCQDRLGGYPTTRAQIRLFCNEQEEHRDEVVQMAQIGDFKGNGKRVSQRVRNPLYKAEPQPQSESAIQPKRTLFNISERLNDLHEVGDDIQQQNLIAQWFEQLGEERDRKLDAYAALITEMTARAAMRKAGSGCKNFLVMRTGHFSRIGSSGSLKPTG